MLLQLPGLSADYQITQTMLCCPCGLLKPSLSPPSAWVTRRHCRCPLHWLWDSFWCPAVLAARSVPLTLPAIGSLHNPCLIS